MCGYFLIKKGIKAKWFSFKQRWRSTFRRYW